MSSEHASEIQRKMYNFIVFYMRREGMPPTNREIGREMQIASTGHVDTVPVGFGSCFAPGGTVGLAV